MLAVGLKDFVAHGTSQKAQIVKEGSINLARVPKINSVVGILGHLVKSFSIVGYLDPSDYLNHSPIV